VAGNAASREVADGRYDIEGQACPLRPNLFSVLFLHLRIAFEGIAAFFQIGAAILSAQGNGLKAKAAAAIQDSRYTVST
jgi:hypothetical protein